MKYLAIFVILAIFAAVSHAEKPSAGKVDRQANFEAEAAEKYASRDKRGVLVGAAYTAPIAYTAPVAYSAAYSLPYAYSAYHTYPYYPTVVGSPYVDYL